MAKDNLKVLFIQKKQTTIRTMNNIKYFLWTEQLLLKIFYKQ